MAAQNPQNKARQTKEFVRLQDLFFLCLARWYWFVISFVVCMGIAALYIKKTPPVYTRSASLLIKEEQSGSNNLAGFTLSELGQFQTSSNVGNEVTALMSPSLMAEVVQRLRLNVSYKTPGKFYRKVAYGNNLPFTASFEDVNEQESAGFTISPEENGKLVLSDFSLRGMKLDGTASGFPNDTLSTPVGRVVVTPTQYFASGEAPSSEKLYVNQISLNAAVGKFRASVSASVPDENTTIVNLICRDYSIQRAEDILNTLMLVYNENWVKDRNQVAVSTSMFIEDRLNVIERELGNVDSDISSFKSQNLVPDVQTVSNLYMNQSNQAKSELLSLNTQLSMARYVRNYVTNATNRNQLLPADLGLEGSGVGTQISEYNKIQLERNNLAANSSESSPMVMELDKNLNTMRGAIVSSIDNLIVTLNTRIQDLQRSDQQATSRIAATPNQAKYLLSVERQQKVKEALYLFLLQKREENELSQAFTAYNTRLISTPTGSNLPTAPVKKNILLIAFLLALLIPTTIIYIRENFNTSIRGRKDLEGLPMPFVGEIPLLHSKKKYRFTTKALKKQEKPTIVVKNHSRNVINEAFRVARTNLEFILGKEGKNKIIMITSMDVNSGKTFLSMNLAACFAVKGKRVLAVDLDLRKASLSSIVHTPKRGLADYLAGMVETYEEVIVKSTDGLNFDVLPVGTLPPNPTELLFEENLPTMLAELRTHYDLILLDCPPVEIVADAAIVGKYAEQTLLVVRAGLLDQAKLPDIEQYYFEKKYPNLSLILNGTESGRGKYGYKYGYKHSDDAEA